MARGTDLGLGAVDFRTSYEPRGEGVLLRLTKVLAYGAIRSYCKQPATVI